jgi:hypothetical protein
VETVWKRGGDDGEKEKWREWREVRVRQEKNKMTKKDRKPEEKGKGPLTIVQLTEATHLETSVFTSTFLWQVDLPQGSSFKMPETTVMWQGKNLETLIGSHRPGTAKMADGGPGQPGQK